MKSPYQIIKTILMTEKSTELAEEQNKYVFKVADSANKIDIARAVETVFDVKVGSVNTMNYLGKRKRMRSAKLGKRADWKKAVVTVTDGEIDVL